MEAYAEAFDARCMGAGGGGARLVDEPGIRGVVGVDGMSRTQLLVLDDRAADVLRALLPHACAGTIRVHGRARRCADVLRQDPSWTPMDGTAMVCADLSTVPDPPLPAGLTLRPVRRVPDDPAEGVPLVAAVEAAARATGRTDDGWVRDLCAYLGSLPDGARLFAAVDGDDLVCATSGSRTFGSDAYVFFVNTVPGWRRRGAGLSMTAAALRVATSSGATRACLDASGAGIPLYERLGFTTAGRITQFSRAR